MSGLRLTKENREEQMIWASRDTTKGGTLIVHLIARFQSKEHHQEIGGSFREGGWWGQDQFNECPTKFSRGAGMIS